MNQNDTDPGALGAQNALRPLDQARLDRALDDNRTASMADEGSVSGARMDYREQVSRAGRPAAEPSQQEDRRSWSGVITRAAAGLAAGVAFGMLWSNLRHAVR